MKHLQPALIACLLTLGHSALAHDAIQGNSTEVSDCDAAVVMVSRSDFAHCESSHNQDDTCLAWARDRKATLQSQVGELCAKEVRTLKGPGGCKDQGKKLRILYHQHKGLPCIAAAGCDGRDGRPAPSHNQDDTCLAWARDRKATLQSQVGELCTKEVRTLKGPGGCKDQGKKLRILYHQHKGLPCTAAAGCDGRDGRPAPHDHTEFVHVTADCN